MSIVINLIRMIIDQLSELRLKGASWFSSGTDSSPVASDKTYLPSSSVESIHLNLS